MTENEAIEELKYDCNELGKAIPCDTSWGKSLENAYAMAIKALEEVQRWHTSESTLILKTNLQTFLHRSATTATTKMNTSRNWKQKWKSTARSAQ